MQLNQSHEQQQMKLVDSGDKKHNPGSSTPPLSSFSLINSKGNRVNSSQSLQTKLDKLVTTFDQLIFKRELDFTVIEKHFGNQIWAGEVVKADNFWLCFIEALISKLGFAEDKAYNAVDFTDVTALSDHVDISYMEVVAGWIWWEIQSKLRAGLRLPSVGDFLSYVGKYLDDTEIRGTQQENTILVIAIFIYLYPLSKIREMAQFNKGYILKYLTDQITDKEILLQTSIYALFALQRVLEASVLLSEVPNYLEFPEKLNEMASFMPEEKTNSDLDRSEVDDSLRAIQASMLAKVTLNKLDELNQLSSLPVILKEHELISLCLRNWFCGTSSGYCNFQMDRSVLSISKKRHLYFEMMYLTTGPIKVGICNNLVKYFKADGVDFGFDMTTRTYTFCFDGYQKVSCRDNQDNIPMVVGEIKPGSVIGIRLDSVDRTVTYYLDGEEIKEKRRTKATRSKRSWESNPYYVTISLAAMQQAIILLKKEEWLIPPNFKEDLHSLYHEDWKFRMCH